MDFYLARLPIFRRLPDDTRGRLDRYFILRRYGRGEPIFEEGGPAREVFLLRSGLAKAVKYSPRVEPFAMGIIVPGQFFGMIAVMDKRPYPVTVVALRDSEVYHIPAAAFEELLRNHPDFSAGVYAQIGSHLRQAQALRVLAKEPVDRRIAYILLQLQQSLGPELKVRREDVAELAGCIPETAIRVLAAFRSKGLISAGWKRITLLKPDRLRALSGGW